jgi:hypothetical protein
VFLYFQLRNINSKVDREPFVRGIRDWSNRTSVRSRILSNFLLVQRGKAMCWGEFVANARLSACPHDGFLIAQFAFKVKSDSNRWWTWRFLLYTRWLYEWDWKLFWITFYIWRYDSYTTLTQLLHNTLSLSLSLQLPYETAAPFSVPLACSPVIPFPVVLVLSRSFTDILSPPFGTASPPLSLPLARSPAVPIPLVDK